MKEYSFTIRIQESMEAFYVVLNEIRSMNVKIDDVGHSDQVIVMEDIDGFNAATSFLIDCGTDFEAKIDTHYLRGYETKS